MNRYKRTHCMASKLTKSESSKFLSVGTPTNPHVSNSRWQQRGTVRLSATIPASLNGCRSLWWNVLRCALNLMEDILSTYYKCTLSAITHKLNISGHMLILWHVDPLLCNNRKRSSYTTKTCLHSNNWQRQQQQRNDVFCVIRANIL
jgi:hypothetical protein